MTNRIFKICVVWCVVLLFNIAASAHSGKTDSAGGHYDRQTGEYHYHHGYPAHSHSVEDGIIDCPYDFDDNTNHNNSSSNQTNSSNSSKGNLDKEKDKISFWEIIKHVFLLILLSLTTLYIIYFVFVMLFFLIEVIFEKVFNKSIEEGKIEKTRNIFIKVGFAVSVLIEFVYLLC